jgi:RNA polymerase sigma factor FliA
MSTCYYRLAIRRLRSPEHAVTAADVADARKLARKFVSRYPVVRHIRDDLEGAAFEGLAQAARSYDPKSGVMFRTFAAHRIYGAMQDYVRTIDAVGRDMRRAAKEGRPDAIALTEIRTVAGERGDNLLKLVPSHGDQEHSARRACLRKSLNRAMAEFTPKEKFVLRGLWVRELTLREVGEEMGVSEARVCQIHTKLLDRLRDRLVELGF